MESRAPGLAPQICDRNLPNCPVGLEQLFVGRLVSVCAEKRLLRRLGRALRGARLRYLPVSCRQGKPMLFCLGTLGLRILDSFTWDSEGVSTNASYFTLGSQRDPSWWWTVFREVRRWLGRALVWRCTFSALVQAVRAGWKLSCF